jgi:hypothetical protein
VKGYKAVDFTDEEIHEYWVDTEANYFATLLKPDSSMPMMILGGKGSGKTHILRHSSFPLQKIRHPENILEGISKEQYLGIYFRCNGLNAGRFGGKGIGAEKWAAVFAYYMELWFAQLLLTIIIELHQKTPLFDEKIFCSQALSLFDDISESPEELSLLLEMLASLRREVDLAVNNCPMSSELNIKIRVTRGKLIFGLPKILREHVKEFSKIMFLYLVDELENLTEDQQKHINTLLREKELPTSFRVGARLYGIRTQKTFSAEEENKEGSEFETVLLDHWYRKNFDAYQKFAKKLVFRRLQKAQCPLFIQKEESVANIYPVKALNDQNPFGFVETNYENKERPYFENLRKKLKEGLRKKSLLGVSTLKNIQTIIKLLSVSENPLLEKANIFLLYRDWSDGRNLLDSAKKIQEEAKSYLQKKTNRTEQKKVFEYFRQDLIVQLRKDCRQKQIHSIGFKSFVEMSQGLPRNLLIILKHIYKWAKFGGENPFDKPVSIKSQLAGVTDDDAPLSGPLGSSLQQAISNLAELFRDIRFSDKPSECSLCTFSVNWHECSEKAKEIIQAAEHSSLLISLAEGAIDKNRNRVNKRYQISSMLAPRWDIPMSKRGDITLSPEEVEAIFVSANDEAFKKIKAKRLERMLAPFDEKTTKPSNEPTLPGMSKK